MPNWGLGRTGQVYVGEEATYGTAPSLAATNALRHLNINLHWDPKSLAKSPERHLHPSQVVLLTRRADASFDIKGQLYPSGTINTLPEADLLLKNSLGNAATSVTLSTTFSGTPTTTGGTIASGTGLAIGQFVQISIAAGANAGVYIRRLTAAGTTPTWTPALPGAPAAGDTLKGGVTYTLGMALPKSLDVVHYPQAPAASAPTREQLGCVCDKLSLMFDSNLETMFQVSGPAQGFKASPQAQPGAFTTVGAESAIPSGLTGAFYYNGTIYQIEKAQIDIVNAMDLQNTALGTSLPVGYFRKGKRAVSVKFDAKVSDDLTAWSPALAASANAMFLQIGSVAGSIWGFYLPNVVLNVPDQPDNDETNNWSFTGTALSTVTGNDELTIGQV